MAYGPNNISVNTQGCSVWLAGIIIITNFNIQLRILLSNVLFFYQWIAVPLLCHLSFFCDQPKYLSNQIRRLGPWETHKCFLKFFWNLQDRCVRQCSREEEFEDTKGVIRIRKSKKNRQHNGQTKKYKRTNNDLQNIHIKIE
jgi:hypothetical protein